MALLPPAKTRRYEVIKFVYTADNGQQFIRTQRIDKDILGNRFIDLPNCFQLAEQKRVKDKIWGDPSNLRRTVTEYEEPDNATGKAQVTIYVPEPPTIGTANCLREILFIVKNKFNPLNIGSCLRYFGEKRFSEIRPNKIESS